MVLITLLWSTAGVVVRHLEGARSFEVTFWRSAFNALALAGVLHWMNGPAIWRGFLRLPHAVWVSGVCWSVMFTAFMLALTLTSVANVLVTMAIGPLITAIFARVFLQHQLPRRTWGAIAVAGVGMAWMFGQGTGANDSGAVLGIAVALAVPVAAAVNWTLMQHVSHGMDEAQDMLPAVFIGAVLSSLATFPVAYPFQASWHDLGWLSALGVFQLALPCLLVVRLTRVLPAPELALLGLLEVIFGVLWAWWLAGEAPGHETLVGGTLVIGALVANELVAMRQPAPPLETPS